MSSCILLIYVVFRAHNLIARSDCRLQPLIFFLKIGNRKKNDQQKNCIEKNQEYLLEIKNTEFQCSFHHLMLAYPGEGTL